jgi:hypothetical protein
MARKHVGPLPLSAYATPGMIGIGDDGMIKKGIGAGLQKVCSHAAPKVARCVRAERLGQCPQGHAGRTVPAAHSLRTHCSFLPTMIARF